MKKSAPKKRGRKFYSTRKLDDLFHQVIKARDKRCVRCGGDKQLGPSHILPKGMYPKMRWIPENALLMCWFKCHKGFWHGSPTDSKTWLNEKYPGLEEYLKERDRTAGRVDKEQTFDILTALHEQLSQ